MVTMPVRFIAVFFGALLGSLLELSETHSISGPRKSDGALLNDEGEETRPYNKDMDIRQAIEPDGDCLNRWEDGKVLYRFDNYEYPLADRYRERLLEGMLKWTHLTCLEFIDIGDDPSRWNETHMYIEDLPDHGCMTLIGVQCGAQEQFMALSRSCGSLGVLMHEVGHALGLFHMHTRPDRDQYVKINWDNVGTSHLQEFEIQESDTYGSPYDYLSIMHYGKKTFPRKRGLTTIETLDPLKQYLIGNPPEPSHYDLFIVNKMYQCSKKCVDVPECLNGGYVGKDCTCICPHNAVGENCEMVFTDYFTPIYDQCGDQHLQEDGVIQTFNYPGIHPVQKCLWYLHAPKGKKAQITFDEFNLYPYRRCKVDYVYVMQDLYSEGKRHCGKTLKGKTITAENQSLVLYWRTGVKWGNTGFSATVKFIDDKSQKVNEEAKE